MSILLNKDSKILIQGITGKEGQRQCESMLRDGANVVAGVTPGKGGQEVEGVPVYDTIAEATDAHGGFDATAVCVPPKFARGAAVEAIEAGIPLIQVFAEEVTTQDSVHILEKAKEKDIRILGPSALGIMVPGETKIGAVGLGKTNSPFSRGPIGVMSKSGGMTGEMSNTLTLAGIGQSTVVGMGGNQIVGTDFVDIMKLFNEDDETKGVLVFGEVGGTYEEKLAEYKKVTPDCKPIVIIVAGKFAGDLPTGTVLGHAGAIVSKGRGGYDSKVKALEDAGIIVAPTLDAVPDLIKEHIL